MNAIFKHAPWDRQQIRRTNERRVYNEEEMEYSDTNGGRYGGALRRWWKQRHFRGGGHHRSENGDGDDYSESGDRWRRRPKRSRRARLPAQFWEMNYGSDDAYLETCEKLIAQYENENPGVNIEVTVQPWDNYYQLFLTAVSSMQHRTWPVWLWIFRTCTPEWERPWNLTM